MKKIVAGIAVGFLLLSIAAVVQAQAGSSGTGGGATGTVPEPASILLIGAGLLGMMLCRKKK